ncbi:unnamed protein product [Arctia plantaginis]|uniref:Uncharacterized protein n=1 Tax=Arctia plantaginis TaxID=874455 RepID=A0A8S1A9S2_ARCPL|nr:unnamed protein product [Arctia plantaginis]CAB3241396.1 unnamed protein product [Arctia plantaginis]
MLGVSLRDRIRNEDQGPVTQILILWAISVYCWINSPTYVALSGAHCSQKRWPMGPQSSQVSTKYWKTQRRWSENLVSRCMWAAQDCGDAWGRPMSRSGCPSYEMR